MKIYLTILFILLNILQGVFPSYYQQKSLEKAREAWGNGMYPVVIAEMDYLKDSLKFEHDGLLLNKANSYYKLGKYWEAQTIMRSQNPDSLLIKEVMNLSAQYGSLWLSEEDIATNAFNQSGLLSFYTGIINGKKVEYDAYVKTSLQYFKNALIKDPSNEKARYNYELLLRFKSFPEEFMKGIRQLVGNYQYENALQLLAPWVEKDPRFEPYRDYAKRLSDIVEIENRIKDNLEES